MNSCSSDVRRSNRRNFCRDERPPRLECAATESKPNMMCAAPGPDRMLLAERDPARPECRAAHADADGLTEPCCCAPPVTVPDRRRNEASPVGCSRPRFPHPPAVIRTNQADFPWLRGGRCRLRGRTATCRGNRLVEASSNHLESRTERGSRPSAADFHPKRLAELYTDVRFDAESSPSLFSTRNVTDGSPRRSTLGRGEPTEVGPTEAADRISRASVPLRGRVWAHAVDAPRSAHVTSWRRAEDERHFARILISTTHRAAARRRPASCNSSLEIQVRRRILIEESIHVSAPPPLPRGQCRPGAERR
jgi:hypothetical protein